MTRSPSLVALNFPLPKSAGDQRIELWKISFGNVLAHDTVYELICLGRPACIFEYFPISFEKRCQRPTIPRIQGTAHDAAFLFSTDLGLKSTAPKLCCYRSGFVPCAENCVERKVAQRFCCTNLK